MNTKDFEVTHWYIKGVGAGERYLSTFLEKGSVPKKPKMITTPVGANESYTQGFFDAFTN